MKASRARFAEPLLPQHMSASMSVSMPRAAVPKAATMSAGKSRFAGAAVRAPRRAVCRAAARKQTVETLAYKVRVVDDVVCMT